jgi:hypothetical protein
MDSFGSKREGFPKNHSNADSKSPTAESCNRDTSPLRISVPRKRGQNEASRRIAMPIPSTTCMIEPINEGRHMLDRVVVV